MFPTDEDGHQPMENDDLNLITVFSAALECESETARAAYLYQACSAGPGLRERVEALLRAHNRSVNFLDQPSPEHAATEVFPPVNCPAISPSSSRAFHEEFRQLLRSRLILAHLITLSFIVMLQMLSLASPPNDGGSASNRPDNGVWWRLIPPCAESLLGILVIWRTRNMSIRSLRIWELACFATHAIYYGWDRFERLGYPDLSVIIGSNASIGFQGLASLQGFGTLILAYGVIVPNTRRRSLLAVGAISLIPLAAIPLVATVNPLLREGHLIPLVVQWATTLIVPSAIAVFAAVRASALQQRAFDAERRADRMGQYNLKRKLGQGGMGEVWLAEHGLLKRPCALKLIRAELAANPANTCRFTREVQAVTGLTHTNTVRVFDYGQAEDGSFYFVMEYLDGPTLEELVKESGPLPPERLVHLLRQLCGALAEAHAAGLVHRDLKPGNVIVATLGGQRDVAKLLDFGLVHDLSTEDGERLTQLGMILGTPAYMCPEQASGDAAVDPRGDIYSLGAVAFFALTGRPPFQAKTIGQYLVAHRTQSPPPLAELCPMIPAGLDAIISRCRAKDPADRFQSANDVVHALDCLTYPSTVFMRHGN